MAVTVKLRVGDLSFDIICGPDEEGTTKNIVDNDANGFIGAIVCPKLESVCPPSGLQLAPSTNGCPLNLANCYGRGSCGNATGEWLCACESAWKGDACQTSVCPDGCGSNEGRGTCDGETQTCSCNVGYEGESCTPSDELKSVSTRQQQVTFPVLFGFVAAAFLDLIIAL